MSEPLPEISASPRVFSRVDSIDAIRGFALAGVAWVHMIEQYLAAPFPEGEEAVAMAGPVDQAIFGLNFAFMTGKFYVLFSLLFGLSFFIQMDRARARGIDFRGRFAWRLVVLAGIGFLHHFFYRGDILMIYGVLGMFLIPLYRASRAVLFTIAGIFFLGTGRYLSFAVFGGGSLFGGESPSPTSPVIREYYDILTQGSLLDVFAVNFVDGLKASQVDFQIGFFGRGYITLGLFSVGLWLGRTRFFETLGEHPRRIRRGLGISFAATIVTIALTVFLFSQIPQPVSFDSWPAAFAVTGMDLANMSLASTYLFLFAWIYQRGWGERMLLSFAPFGRMALTNYLMQSLIGTFIFYGWGLGRLGEWRTLYALWAGIGVIVLQMALSRIWVRHFLYGPVEWLWRSLTWLKIFPFRRPSP